jgi:hypothetical protein
MELSQCLIVMRFTRPNPALQRTRRVVRRLSGATIATDQSPKNEPKKSSGCLYAFLGAGAGGCLLPTVLFFIAAALGDTGGPLFTADCGDNLLRFLASHE